MIDAIYMTKPHDDIGVVDALEYIKELRSMVHKLRESREFWWEVAKKLQIDNSLMRAEIEKLSRKIKELETTPDGPKRFSEVLPPPWGPDYAWGCVLKSGHRDNVIIRGTKEGLEEVQRRWTKLEKIENILNPQAFREPILPTLPIAT